MDIDRMPDFAFRMMSVTIALKGWLFLGVDKRVAGFGIQEGMTVVDYGCGPGRYTTRFAKLVGERGKYTLSMCRNWQSNM